MDRWRQQTNKQTLSSNRATECRFGSLTLLGTIYVRILRLVLTTTYCHHQLQLYLHLTNHYLTNESNWETLHVISKVWKFEFSAILLLFLEHFQNSHLRLDSSDLRQCNLRHCTSHLPNITHWQNCTNHIPMQPIV